MIFLCFEKEKKTAINFLKETFNENTSKLS